MDAQLSSDLLLGVIGLIALIGLVGTVGAFFTMGRSAYRKD
jgi:hypothetical protein